MKKALLVSFLLPFLFCSLAAARPAARGKSLAGYNIQIENPLTATSTDELFSAAQADTYWLGEYDFDSLGTCAPEGWFGVDWTAQPGTMFHVDTFRPITGDQSMWCGAPASSADPWCSYRKLPGYGNGWDQNLMSRVFTASGTVTAGFKALYDSEPGYDYTYFQYYDGSDWIDLASYTGSNGSVPSVVNLAVPTYGTNNVRVRFWFQSDGAWSDEDGLWNTSGAFIVDDITIDDSILGNIDTEDWEGESVGATASNDGDWTAGYSPGYGDFSGLFSGLAVLQEGTCSRDITCLWGFFNGSTDYYSCATPVPHPEQQVVPYENDGLYIANEIWSPWIDLTGGGTVPAGASATFEFYCYRDLPLNNLIFGVWHVRSRLGSGCPGPWQDRNIGFYGPNRDWQRSIQPVGDLINLGDDQIQLALGCMDMCGVWCGKYGDGNCHSHSPLYDRVAFYRVATTGPLFSARTIDMFQDNFPENGSTTGAVRIDAAIDRMPSTSPNIYPGDSLIFNVAEFSVGLASDGDSYRAAVYCFVRSTGGGNPGMDWQAPETGMWAWNATRFPLIGGPTAGGFYQFQCDTCYQDVAQLNPTPDKFCFDLNDEFFAPPARVDFYFGAKGANGHWSYWTPFTGHTLVQSKAEAKPDEMQCLPTGASDILYVDNFSGRGGREYWDTAFEILGLAPDRYDKKGPSSLVGNGIGARAVPAQITNVYKVILYDCGDLSAGNVGDGTGDPEKSRDAQLLGNFLDQTSVWNPGLYLCGDDVASEMYNKGGIYASTIFPFMSYTVLSGNHTLTEGISPLAIGSTVGLPSGDYIFQHSFVPDTLIAYGGCPLINDFDVLQAAGTAVEAMKYAPTASGAVLTQLTANAQGMIAGVVLSGFSYIYIRDDRMQFPNDRTDHLDRILRWFETTPEVPTGTGDPPLVTSLSQNYPNPFNPATTIEFSLKEKARASLKVYNVSGQLVRTIVDEELDAGVYKNYAWDGLDNRGESVASGVYFYRLVTRDFDRTRKMVLLK